MKMNFGKFELDIKEIFEEKIKKFEDLSQDEKVKYSFDLNYVLKRVLNSYYFEKMYEAKLLKEKINDNIYYYIRTTQKYDSYYDFQHLENGFFYSEMSNKHFLDGNVNENERISDLSLDIIENLSKKDPIYNILFENNKIKQSLYLKMRHSINFTIIHDSQDINNELEKIHKFGKTKATHPVDKAEDISSSLSHYGFRWFFLRNINQPKLLVVAHNDNEICGVSAISNDGYTGLNYLSYIDVCPSFRGHGLGKKMFNEIKKEIENSNELLEMSNYTELGLKHLSAHIDPIVDASDNIMDAMNVAKMQTFFNILKRENIDINTKSKVIKEVYINVKNGLEINKMSYNEITNITNVMINKIRNNFENLYIEDEKLNNNARNKIKKIFAKIF